MGFPSGLASEIISAVLGCLYSPPVDLDLVAREVFVSAVWRTQYAGLADGCTDFRAGRPVIYIDQNADMAKARFIYAHEIAHVMLRRPEAKHVLAKRGRSSLLNDEERLADKIAA